VYRANARGIVGAVTVSIVARDEETRCFGVATASLGLAVGSRVPVLPAGGGAAAVQARSPAEWQATIDTSLTQGWPAARIHRDLDRTAGAQAAQVAIIDEAGSVAVLSGRQVEPEAGYAQASGVVVIANLMERPGVPEAALAAYLEGTGSTLSGRLLRALAAADALGGDIRGRQSAALRVVAPRGSDPMETPDLRVDDASEPIRELERLHLLWRAHQLLRSSMGADGVYRDVDRALAAVNMAPDDQTCLGGAGLALLRAGDVAQAVSILRRLSAIEPRTPARLRRLIDTGMLDERAGRRALQCLLDDGPPRA
jgi:uncharacterized Ntn-hydrolase superfamily protein